MKIRINSRKTFKLAATCLVATMALSACTKDDGIIKPEQRTDTASVGQVIKVETLIRFLSISLTVPEDEIKLNNDGSAFLIRGHIFNRAEIEEYYRDANVYHATYEK
ncbi:hypothetical protein LPB86_08620 [Pedobacter sp. MC2016-14]|uniref:hypothetical protein n=1 Tax=Pedobacter sp. MC2016-14 TaxID=2897327 RepID=UPI001E4DBB79|nr:hypothetical protein [Pedobacter sp. MC2016-14]MCD0488290.1 hypothetical protein [Pedobacter sp. MC2016-14]